MMNMDQFEILRTIDKSPGTIGRALKGSAGGKSLKGLFMNRLVRRERCKNGFRYFITDEGREFLKNKPCTITIDTV